MFLKDNPPGLNFQLNFNTLWSIIYIMVTGIFEVIVFYSFLRTVFEKSFGIIPAIILTALFYSFHHIGFQPEFLKLFFVGIIYAVVFRGANSALLIYPFFWGVGASYDVLIQSNVVGAIVYPEIRSIILIAGLIVIFSIANYKNYFHSKNAK
ncbi:MAG: type II CAAX prenyl endopeptidase Rce1 family protein [Patescibacteria group bacterium]